VSYRVGVLDEVRTADIPSLAELDERLPRKVAEIIRALYTDPWIGAEMRERYNMTVLAGCRKVAFDVPDSRGRERARKRFRFVYTNEPHDASIANIVVLAIGPRDRLAAYRKAAARQGRRRRQRP